IFSIHKYSVCRDESKENPSGGYDPRGYFKQNMRQDLVALVARTSLPVVVAAFLVGGLRATLSLETTYRLHGQPQTPFVIGFDRFNTNVLPYFEHVVNVVNAVIGDLGNMQQTVTARQYLHNGTKIKYP